jgi:hypothetical protein
MSFSWKRSAILCLSAGLVALAAARCEAANVVVSPDADFSATPYTISFGGGAATFTFTYINDGYTADAVSTGGNGLVNSSTFPGPGPQPIAYELGAVHHVHSLPVAARDRLFHRRGQHRS